MTITNIILGITVLLSFYAFSNRDVMYKLIMNPYTVYRRNQYYRFITSGFIHGDHLHLIVNMFSFYFFGLGVQTIFQEGLPGTFEGFGQVKGAVYFVALYILGIIVSDVPTYFKQRENPVYNSLGASGGVSSVVFAMVMFDPLRIFKLYAIIPIPGFIFGIAYIMFSYYYGKRSNDNINHDAHLWGAVFGLVFCIVVHPPVVTNFIAQVSSWTLF
jgi:membrane associated rhomboid family serine protease